MAFSAGFNKKASAVVVVAVIWTLQWSSTASLLIDDGHAEENVQDTKWQMPHYCIYCRSGRRIFIGREESWTQVATRWAWHAVEGISILVPHGHAAGAVANIVSAAAHLGSKAHGAYTHFMDAYNAVSGSAGSDEVKYVTVEYYDPPQPFRWFNGQGIYKEERKRGTAKVKGFGIPEEETKGANENKILNSLFLFKKNWQNLWVAEVGCWAWNTCTRIAMEDNREEAMSPLTMQIIQENEFLCGGDQGGITSNKSGIKILDGGVPKLFGSEDLSKFGQRELCFEAEHAWYSVMFDKKHWKDKTDKQGVGHSKMSREDFQVAREKAYNDSNSSYYSPDGKLKTDLKNHVIYGNLLQP